MKKLIIGFIFLSGIIGARGPVRTYHPDLYDRHGNFIGTYDAQVNFIRGDTTKASLVQQIISAVDDINLNPAPLMSRAALWQCKPIIKLSVFWVANTLTATFILDTNKSLTRKIPQCVVGIQFIDVHCTQ